MCGMTAGGRNPVGDADRRKPAVPNSRVRTMVTHFDLIFSLPDHGRHLEDDIVEAESRKPVRAGNQPEKMRNSPWRAKTFDDCCHNEPERGERRVQWSSEEMTTFERPVYPFQH